MGIAVFAGAFCGGIFTRCSVALFGNVGFFGSIFGFDIGHADWIVDPGASMVSEFDYMIQIDGTVVDEDGDWFDYKLFLRPWGMDWEDIRYADTSEMLYDDMLPLYYDDWYLPQIDGTIN